MPILSEQLKLLTFDVGSYWYGDGQLAVAFVGVDCDRGELLVRQERLKIAPGLVVAERERIAVLVGCLVHAIYHDREDLC